MRAICLLAVLVCSFTCSGLMGQDTKSIFDSRSSLASKMQLTSVTRLIGHKYRMSIKLVEVSLSAAKAEGLELDIRPQLQNASKEHTTSSMYELLDGLKYAGVADSHQLPDVVSKSGENVGLQFEIDNIKGEVNTVLRVKDGDVSHTTVQLFLIDSDRRPYRETYKAKLALGQTYLLKSLDEPTLGKTHWLFVNIDDIDAE